MSEIKLLPCPFCGGKAKVIRRKKSCNDDGFLFEVSVKCEVCDSESRRCLEDEYKAIMIWNNRKPMERIIERLEETKTKRFVSGITNDLYEFGCCHGMDAAIEIVKEEGGIE